MSTLLSDLRFGARMLWKDRRFTLVALVALTLSIGATTAIYTFVDAVLLRPLPFPRAAELVDILSVGRSGAGPSSYPDFADFRARSHALVDAAAYTGTQAVLTGHDDPRNVDALAVTPSFFRVLGVSPLIGRGFDDRDGVVGSTAVVISHALWQGLFRGDPDVVGRAISVNGKQAQIVGVMPAGFRFPPYAGDPAPLVYLPLPRDTNDMAFVRARGMHAFGIVGRMRAGTTVAAAQADLDAVAAGLRAEHPSEHEDRNLGVRVRGLRETVIGPVRPALLLLLAAVACVLAIACVNIAGLLLARATVRQREVAVRATLGATRGRIVRQLLTESLLLGVGGGALGLLVALWLVDVLAAVVAPALPRVHAVAVDARVLGVTFALTVGASVAFGLVPALHASRADLQAALKDALRATDARSRRSRNLLLVVELAIAVVLLAGASLTLRSFAKLRAVDPGFRADGLVVAQISLPSRYPDDDAADRYYRALATRVAELPGAQAVGFGAPLPFSHSGARTGVNLPGLPPSPALPAARVESVSPGYFAAMGMRLVRGRNFATADDDKHAAPVAVVSEAFARKLFPGEDPIGRRFEAGVSSYGSKDLRTAFEIVGVVNDTHMGSLDRAPRPAFYLPLGRVPMGQVGVVVRTRAPAAMLPALRNAVLAVDHDLPPTVLATMDALLDETVQTQRMLMVLLGLFGALALALATIGVYGVMSYSVSQRRREIGIRMAVGARRGQVLGLVVGESLKLGALGLVVGVGAALGAARLIRSQLFGVTESDPLTLVAVASIIAVVALAASIVPAWRATRVDPMVTLRDE